MDGLTTSFQQYNRLSSFAFGESGKATEEERTPSKGKNPHSSTNTNTNDRVATLQEPIAGVSDKQEGQGGGNGSGNSQFQQNTIQAGVIEGPSFGEILDSKRITEAIIDKALQVVSSIRDVFLIEYAKMLGTTREQASDIADSIQKGNGSSFSMIFDSVIQGADMSQYVFKTEISFSSSFMQQNFFNGADGTTAGMDFSFTNISFGASMSQTNNGNSITTNFNFMFNSTQINASLSGTPGGNSTLNLIDPLIIDLGGEGVELSTDYFQFDLDADGELDQISRPAGNSGFLALDKNEDGVINDGKELFGTQNGDGFKDLAQHDSNNDGKIDKNDPIFEKLRIWQPGADGKGKLIGLGEVGIGAIYLDAQKNQHIFESASGEVLGVQQKSGTYERVDGTTGGIHHVDLAKRQEEQQEETTSNASKEKGIARYKQSQGDLERLRFLNNKPTSAEDKINLNEGFSEEFLTSILKDITQKLGKENVGLLQGNEDAFLQRFSALQKGEISNEELTAMQIDFIFSKNRNPSSHASILNSMIFGDNLSQVNASMFQYDALLRAQRLLT
ncbi:hypothetical protein CCZ01_06230 [Helicobacter monodelphidis]|uniref:hypothetical protein n=1 Tax=Helicobacter sp. 15-1451 TaxID=2004995 RepID=UPI000DCD1EFF|nr:hypothetical protein [Helicobacter sp. 15-1451]RAX57432.1 hypothetical protein CCZ01_06230 [Helicobacter sp. 15-1451]